MYMYINLQKKNMLFGKNDILKYYGKQYYGKKIPAAAASPMSSVTSSAAFFVQKFEEKQLSKVSALLYLL